MPLLTFWSQEDQTFHILGWNCIYISIFVSNTKIVVSTTRQWIMRWKSTQWRLSLLFCIIISVLYFHKKEKKGEDKALCSCYSNRRIRYVMVTLASVTIWQMKYTSNKIFKNLVLFGLRKRLLFWFRALTFNCKIIPCFHYLFCYLIFEYE